MDDVFFSYKDEIVNLGRVFCIQKIEYKNKRCAVQLYSTGDCNTIFQFRTIEFRDKIWNDIKKILNDYSTIFESEVEGEEEIQISSQRVVPEIKNEKF
jgi:hypothetical protein